MSVHPSFLQLADHPDDPAIAAHLAECAACRAQARLARAALESDPDEVPDDVFNELSDTRRRATHQLSLSLGGYSEDTLDPARALLPGDTFERYVVEEELGRGGNGTVYRVRHTQLGSLHALKLLHSANNSERERLMREGRVQSSLRHRNVVPVTDVIEVHGAPGLIMEWVDGPSLAQWLKDNGQPPLKMARCLGTDILRGVAAAHRAGVVHRDLKPHNVLLASTDEGLVARVADFGLARHTTAEDALELTGSGRPLGTPAYMAPEQVHDATRADARSDVFSLGAVLYELLSGQRAFAGSDLIDTFDRVRAVNCAPLDPELPRELVHAVEAALQKEPADRPADGGALLRLWTDDAASTTPPPVRATRWPLIAGVAAAVVALAGWWLWPTPTDTVESTAWTAGPDRRITALPNTLQVYAMDLDADGSELVYADSRGLWHQPVDGGAVRQLVDDGPYHSVSFFPDSERVLVSGPYQGTSASWEVRLDDGTVTRVLPDHAKLQVLSPDGTRLATADASGLWVRDLDGSHRQRLRPMSSTDVTAGLVWSPDGNALAAVHHSATGTTAWLELTAADGSWTRSIDEDPRLLSLTLAPLAWLPGDRLLVSKLGRDGAHLYELSDASHALSMDAAHEVLHLPDTTLTRLVPSDDGERIAYTRIDTQLQTWLIPPDAPAERFRAGTEEWDQAPVGWRDGQLMVATLNGPRGLSEYDPVSGHSERLYDGPIGRRPIQLLADDVKLYWSADQKDDKVWLILERTKRESPGEELLRVEVRGTSEWVNLRCRNERCLLSQPQGDVVVFSWLDPQTGALTETWRETLTSAGFAWDLSADAERLVTVRSEPRELRLHDLAGNVLSAQPLPFNRGQQVAFAPDGRSVYVSGLVEEAETPYQLLHVELDGPSHVLWTDGSAYLHAPNPSPDGSLLALAAYNFDDDVWLLGARPTQ